MDAVSLMYMTFVLVVSIAILGTIIPIYKKPMESTLLSIRSKEAEFFAQFIATNLIQYIYKRRSNEPLEYDKWNGVLKAMALYAQQETLAATPYLAKDPMFLLSLSIVQFHDSPVSQDVTDLINAMIAYIRNEIVVHELHCGSQLDTKHIAFLVSSHPLFNET